MSDLQPLSTTPDLIAAAATLEAAHRSKAPGFLPLLTAQIFAAAVLTEDFGIEGLEDNPEAVSAAFKVFVLALKDPMHPDLDRFRIDPEAAQACREGASA